MSRPSKRLATLLHCASAAPPIYPRGVPSRRLSSHGGGGQSDMLVYAKFGDPSSVVRLVTQPVQHRLRPGEVQVRWLAAPVNPADINMIQGVYAIKPPLPAVGGNEGVALVEAVDSAVRSVSPGDHVIPSRAGLGTWQTRSILHERELIKLEHDLKLEQAAQLMVNPCTAYRLLCDFAQLRRGDTIVQNGATTAVGQYVCQLAHQLGYHTVNVIRTGGNVPGKMNRLKSLGADHVLTDVEFKKTAPELWKHHRRPKLALNCVGGRQAAYLAHALDHGGAMVTYGGLSMQPLMVPTGAMIFKQIQLYGFWMSHWYSQVENHIEAVRMLDEIAGMMHDSRLKTPPVELIPFKKYREALNKAKKFVSPKPMLLMEEE